MTAIYNDHYLDTFKTPEIEAQAEADIAVFGTFDQEWIDRLLPPQVYKIICIANQAAPDDLFTAKLKTYRSEFDRLLIRAQTATPDSEGNTPPIFAIPMERG